MSNNENIEQWKQRFNEADIITIFGKYLTLKKTGKSYQGLCPFHAEKTPSFTIYPETKTFKCFGCGKHGDFIDFIEFKENVEFKEAVKIIADLTYTNLPDSFLTGGNTELSNKQKEFNAYHEALISNTEALKYLESRGIKDNKLFGYDTKTQSYKIAYYKGYNLNSIITHNIKTEPKYLFETGINKDYPFNLAAVSNDNELWIFEGLFDALSIQQNFNKNSIAVLGSELKKDTLPYLKRYQNIIIAFDKDTPGYKATFKAITTLYKSGFKNVHYLVYKDYRDLIVNAQNYPYNINDIELIDFKYKDLNDALQQSETELVNKVLNQIEHGYKFLVIDLILNTKGLNDLEKTKKIDEFLKLLYQFPGNVVNGALNFYKLKTGIDLHAEFEQGKTLLNVNQYQEKLTELINKTPDFSLDTLSEIKQITAETETQSHTITPYTVDEFFIDLTNPPERMQSAIIPDVYYYAGALSFIAGRTGHGKTTFLINECIRQAEKHKTAFISLEENKTFVSKKLLIAKNNNDENKAKYENKLLTLELKNYAYNEHKDTVNELFNNVMIFDTPDRIEPLEKLILATHEREQINVFFIDYIQRIYFQDTSYNKMIRQEQIKHINSRLLNLAKEHNIYIIMGAQFNRTVTKEDEIFSTDIYREAGDIEQDGNLIINLWNRTLNKDKSSDELLYYIAKNRNGKPCSKYTSLINLAYLQIEPATPESKTETDKPGNKEKRNNTSFPNIN